ncbi:MAG: 2Fe-2S iron-sulfur cluster binding domain-containing protein, partial [Anaerolineales bacterium]
MPYQIDFQPVGRRGSFQSDVTLLEAARTLGVELVSLCGGQGSCNHCKVRLLEGTL